MKRLDQIKARPARSTGDKVSIGGASYLRFDDGSVRLMPIDKALKVARKVKNRAKRARAVESALAPFTKAA